MEDMSFEILEEKINTILSKMDQLKVENHDLRQKNQKLQATVEEKEKKIALLKSESMNYSDMQNNIQSYKEKHDRIRSKVENLLQKLKEFEDTE